MIGGSEEPRRSATWDPRRANQATKRDLIEPMAEMTAGS